MEEVKEIDLLLQSATFPRVRNALSTLRAEISAGEAATASTKARSVPSSTTAQLRQPATSSVSGSSGSVKVSSSGHSFIPINDFAWDQGEYNSPTVSVYIDLPGVGGVKDNVTCNFTASSFDLQVAGLEGKNYRLLKDNLDKDILPDSSKFVVKKDKIVVKLSKKKGEYSYENWTSLTSKKSKEQKDAQKKDPMGGIMDMMKDMYNDGDENMKKVIGEAMMKAQRGEKSEPPSMPDMPDMKF